MAYGGRYSPEELESIHRRAVREELDYLGGSFQWERFLGIGLDAYFLTRVSDLNGVWSSAPTSQYWKQLDYKSPYRGEFRVPANLQGVATYSRYAFRYPRIAVSAVLPAFTLPQNETSRELWIGLEDGGAGHICAFRLYKTSTVDNKLYAFLSTLKAINLQDNDVSSLRPSDWSTAAHTYQIALTKNLALFMIDSKIVHIGVLAQGITPAKVRENVPPYGVSIYPYIPRRVTTLLEVLVGRSVPTEDVVANISLYGFRVNEGNEVEPLALPLYIDSTNTKLAGYSVSSGSVTSHPIPIWGYENKTIYFMANQAGTLSIQIYTLSGNWREYDSVSVTAGKLLYYKITGDALLARVVYTPSTYPATINEAEADMY